MIWFIDEVSNKIIVKCFVAKKLLPWRQMLTCIILLIDLTYRISSFWRLPEGGVYLKNQNIEKMKSCVNSKQ